MLLRGREPDAGTVALAQLVVESSGDAAGRERAGCRHCCAGATSWPGAGCRQCCAGATGCPRKLAQTKIFAQYYWFSLTRNKLHNLHDYPTNQCLFKIN